MIAGGCASLALRTVGPAAALARTRAVSVVFAHCVLPCVPSTVVIAVHVLHETNRLPSASEDVITESYVIYGAVENDYGGVIVIVGFVFVREKNTRNIFISVFVCVCEKIQVIYYTKNIIHK